jgi:hypothetical protein
MTSAFLGFVGVGFGLTVAFLGVWNLYRSLLAGS